MISDQQLCDTNALTLHRVRAERIDADQWFLHDLAAGQLQERLADVNRRFTKPAIIGPRAEAVSRALGLKARCVTDAEVLELEPVAHDLVVHFMALHWANDPVGQLIQMRRALEPDGLMLAVLFAGETLKELRTALTQAETELRGGLSPRIAPMAELRALGGLLQRAGLALPVADTEVVPVTYPSPYHLMHELRAMGESNALASRHRRFAPRALFTRAAAIYGARAGANGRVKATFELAHLSGWAPSDNQPKPLRPGSATTRLADVLGVPEQNPDKGRT